MKTSYSILKRNEEDFFNYITSLIDLLEKSETPDFNYDCNFCNFTKKQIDLMEQNDEK